MKDKRLYLKLACLLEFIYVFVMLIYNLFFNKINDQVIAKVFLLLIGLFINIMLYKESKKDIRYLKENRKKVIFASIWLFFEPVLPGILCFIFLKSISPKKEVKLPLIEDTKKDKMTYIKSIILIIFFIGIMFFLPNFKIFYKIPSYLIYIFILLMIIACNYKELISNFKVFIKNFKIYLPFIFKRYISMLCIMVLVAFPVVLINKGATSNNQELINEMFKRVPFWTFVLSVFYAPFAEEGIFRMTLSKFFDNKTVFIVISGLLFGSLHVIDKFETLTDLLYILQYSALGICLAKAYTDSKNIFVSMSMHFMQNFLAAVMVLLLQL